MAAVRRRLWMACIEAVALTVSTALVVRLALRLAGAVDTARDWAALAAAAVVGYLAADLASGLVHWFCDKFFEEDTPIVGRMIIAPFREHHRDPLALTRHGFLDLNGNNALVAAPVLLWASRQEALSAFGVASLVFFSLAVLATNQLHAWAHAPRAPRPVRWLQQGRLILTPGRHARHHRDGHVGTYCVTAGWLNPLLDRVRFFESCEAVLASLGLPRAAGEGSR